MPSFNLECSLCGYRGHFRNFQQVLMLDGKAVDHTSDSTTWNRAVERNEWSYVCDGNCRGRRLSWWERRKIKRSLEQWTQ